SDPSDRLSAIGLHGGLPFSCSPLSEGEPEGFFTNRSGFALRTGYCSICRRDLTRPALPHRVARRTFPEPPGPQFGRAYLRFEIDVHQAEAVTEPVDPLEIVLCTREEISIDWYTVGCCALQLREVGAQKHDPVGVVHLAIVRNRVRSPAAVL